MIPTFISRQVFSSLHNPQVFCVLLQANDIARTLRGGDAAGLIFNITEDNPINIEMYYGVTRTHSTIRTSMRPPPPVLQRAARRGNA